MRLSVVVALVIEVLVVVVGFVVQAAVARAEFCFLPAVYHTIYMMCKLLRKSTTLLDASASTTSQPARSQHPAGCSRAGVGQVVTLPLGGGTASSGPGHIYIYIYIYIYIVG